MTIHSSTKSEKINFGFILNNVLCYLERLPNKAVDITLQKVVSGRLDRL